MSLTIFQYISYGVLSLIAIYLIYMITISIIWLFLMLIPILIYGGLLIAVVWFLHKQGFFELFHAVDNIEKTNKIDNDSNL